VSAGWRIYIAILTIANILGCVWLLWWMRRGHGEAAQTSVPTTGHVWDGDLREYNNPLPRWWLWLFILSIVFGAVYLVLYPGLVEGTLGWTAVKQHTEQAAQNEAVIQHTLAPFADQPVVALSHDPAALRVGRNLFVNNCATCHGSDGRGAPGFPNLTDSDWLWGETPERILDTIEHGRTAVMSPWKSVLGAQGVEDVLAYVLSLSGRQVAVGDLANGKQKFAQICSACHGVDGKGNQLLGAPNLTDNIWLFGGSVDAVRETISNGRESRMPAQFERLGATRIKLLAAYVLSLGAQQAANAGVPATSVH
jgi:cytochrome c oxidase cbb3-type subunit III